MPTYEQYRAMLPVHKHRLDDELEIQAQFMEQISSEAIRQNARLLESKLTLEKVEGRLLAEFKDDDPKMTVQLLDAKVKRDPERTTAWQSYLANVSEHAKWQGLLEAWRQKGYSIKTLADLYSAQYFQLSSHQSRQRSERGNDPAKQDEVRAALRVAGRSSVATDEERTQRELALSEPPKPRRRGLND